MNIEDIKKEIVEKYGTEPTICYFYYLWNAVDYVGEEMLRKSFASIKGQGDEVIVGDYGSTDKTREIAKEYGFKVISVRKTKDIIFHDSKIFNKVIAESKCNFLIDLNVNTVYPKEMDNFFKNWIENNDITEKQLAVRGLFKGPNGEPERKYAASCLFYRPFLYEARGVDERTYYGYGTTHYTIRLIEIVYDLKWDNQPLDFVHEYHNHIKLPRWKKVFKFGDVREGHNIAMKGANRIIKPLIENYYNGILQVKNSYIKPNEEFKEHIESYETHVKPKTKQVEKIEEVKERKIRSKLIVYTAIFGDYDTLKDPLITHPRIRFVCFSDKERDSKIWETIVVDIDEPSPRRMARKIKILSHKYVGNGINMWIDGSCQLRVNPLSYVREHLEKSDFVLTRHPRNCIYEEAKKCLQVGKGEPNKINEQMEFYKSQNYPQWNRLVDTTVLLRKITPEVIKIENDWWYQLNKFSERDQLSFNYVVWKNKFKYGTFNYRIIVSRLQHIRRRRNKE